ncbi:MAG TPA: hypothetical protein VD902_05295, partial [Symbiobacteriaceae bacterium]|nr:hypothetical protein [Symbiobacteriaceae bacterium]
LSISAGVARAAALVTFFGVSPLVHRLPASPDHSHEVPLLVEVTATEYGFTPDVVEVPMGRPVKLVFINNGALDHDLTVPRAEYRLSARRDRRAEPPGLHLFARAGDRAALELVFLRGGTYEAFCSIAGHQDQGMKLTLKAVAAGTEP